MAPIEESRLFSDLLGLGTELSLVDLPQAADRVIRDFNVSGRFLNCAHQEVREILAALPDTVGNPVRLLLLQAYLDIDNWKMADARAAIKSLLTDKQLSEKAQLTTGPLTREYLAQRLARVLSSREES